MREISKMEIILIDEGLKNRLQGNDGKLLEGIMEKSGAKLEVDGDELHVEGDGWAEWISLQVLEALSFGFEEKKALKLFEDDFFLEVLDLKNIFRGSKKLIERYKARVIGTDGKARKKLEELSNTAIVVAEESIALLGSFEDLKNAKEAIVRIFEGAPHDVVYKFLEKRRFTMKKEELKST